MRVIAPAAHPDTVGALNVTVAEVYFSDKGASGVASPQTVLTLPAGSILFEVQSQIVQAFNSGTSDLLTVGKTGSASAYQDSGDLTEGSTGWQNDVVASALPEYFAAETAILVTYTSTGTAPTTGRSRHVFKWARVNV